MRANGQILIERRLWGFELLATKLQTLDGGVPCLKPAVIPIAVSSGPLSAGGSKGRGEGYRCGNSLETKNSQPKGFKMF